MEAFRGRERRISEMYDYACAATVRGPDGTIWAPGENRIWKITF